MKKVYFIFILSCAAFSLSCNVKNKELEEAVDLIRKNNCYSGMYVGEAGITPDEYIAFTKMCEKATDKELLELLKDENGVVRAYAADALAYKKAPVDYFSIALDAVDDIETVETFEYCFLNFSQCGDCILESIFPYLSGTDQQKIYRLLLERRRNFSVTYRFLETDLHSDELYDAARKWAEEVNREDYASLKAVGYISTYKKEQDWNLVLSIQNLDKSIFYKSCLNYIPSHNKELEKIFEEALSEVEQMKEFSLSLENFYECLAVMHNDFSKRMLHIAEDKTGEDNNSKYGKPLMLKVLKNHNSDGFYNDFFEGNEDILTESSSYLLNPDELILDLSL